MLYAPHLQLVSSAIPPKSGTFTEPSTILAK